MAGLSNFNRTCLARYEVSSSTDVKVRPVDIVNGELVLCAELDFENTTDQLILLKNNNNKTTYDINERARTFASLIYTETACFYGNYLLQYCSIHHRARSLWDAATLTDGRVRAKSLEMPQYANKTEISVIIRVSIEIRRPRR